jgi:dUTP pyrophosphatase
MDYIPNPPVKFFTLPGGKLPKQESEGAIGYDVCLRAVVSPFGMDQTNSNFRKSLFDFSGKPAPSEDPEEMHAAAHVFFEEGEWVYRLGPRESALVGIGFATEMPYPLFYWVAPRSGLASKHRITVTNAPGTVDPDYRGEAGVLVLNIGDRHFDLKHNMRIAQIIFQWALIPTFASVSSYTDLTPSKRGAGGFGSTGLK